ncbi:MAG TPA: phosphotransferase [Solirubrobacteraceae bacterium]|jgi:Ser/Thr protein kinase RdoA (MazF antagonist)|nr:phosphotransferase [Solirubrobacteraceae bacterium]
MAEAEELVAHIAERYDFRAQTLFTFDQDVVLLRRDDGPNWVARIFPPQRPRARVLDDAEILDWLAEHGYPAERCATADPVSELNGQTVLVTKAVSGVPRAGRRAAIKDAGGIRGLGELLGRLHTLPQATGAAARPGGAWHHMVDGSPTDELAAARNWLEAAESDAPARDLSHFGMLADALDAADACDGLPEALIHPDFVLANVVATPEPSMVLVDWAAAGRGPRLWSLAFLLWAEGYKDLRRVDLAIAGYRRHITLEPDELDRLEAAVGARPLVFDIWRLHNRSLSAADAARNAVQTRELARAIAARARAAINS